MPDLICPCCMSDAVLVARDMKATRVCGTCHWTWLPIDPAVRAIVYASRRTTSG